MKVLSHPGHLKVEGVSQANCTCSWDLIGVSQVFKADGTHY